MQGVPEFSGGKAIITANSEVGSRVTVRAVTEATSANEPPNRVATAGKTGGSMDRGEGREIRKKRKLGERRNAFLLFFYRFSAEFIDKQPIIETEN